MPDPRTQERPDENERRQRAQEMLDTLQQSRFFNPGTEERYQQLQRQIEELRAMLGSRRRRKARRADTVGTTEPAEPDEP